jgi:hypothetical protein
MEIIYGNLDGINAEPIVAVINTIRSIENNQLQTAKLDFRPDRLTTMTGNLNTFKTEYNTALNRYNTIFTTFNSLKSQRNTYKLPWNTYYNTNIFILSGNTNAQEINTVVKEIDTFFSTFFDFNDNKENVP